jgi:hypothetical protein
MLVLSLCGVQVMLGGKGAGHRAPESGEDPIRELAE